MLSRLRVLGVLGVVLLAGCAGTATPGGTSSGPGGGDVTGSSTSTPTSSTTPGATPSGEPSPSSSDGAAGDVPAELTVVLDDTGSGATRTWTVTCVPTGGDHPDPVAACAAVAAAGAAGFAPVPADQMCTQQWGGPQKAAVDGVVDGTPVHARFDRTDGCQISRWDRLADLLGSRGGA